VIHGYSTPDICDDLEAAIDQGYDYLLNDSVLELVSDPVVFTTET
jgi:hypothetical protein